MILGGYLFLSFVRLKHKCITVVAGSRMLMAELRESFFHLCFAGNRKRKSKKFTSLFAVQPFRNGRERAIFVHNVSLVFKLLKCFSKERDQVRGG